MTDDTHNEQICFEAIGSMAESLANDFNNWISIVSSHAMSIADSHLPKTKAHDEALRILEASQKAETITRRLRGIFNASRRNNSEKLKLLNVAHAIKDAISLAESSLSNQKISIVFAQTDRNIHVNANYNQFIDCLTQILFNAAESMPDGGTINIDTSLKHLDESDFVIIRVRDSGQGIPKEDISKIFDPFFTTKSERNSIGLGLTVAQKLIKIWGGEIKVRSQYGRGASFRIFIPKAEHSATARAKKTKTVEKEILIIDNNQEVLSSIVNCLSMDGHKTHALSNSEEAISYYRDNTHKITLIIIDVLMPGTSGEKVMREILDINHNAVIIMTSGFSRDYIKNHLDHGSWKFIQKPIDNVALQTLVRKTLKENKPWPTSK